MKKIFLIIFLFSVGTASAADTTIFSCFMKNGKHLAVTDEGSSLRYSYGRAGKPEMVFSNSKSSIEKHCGTQACNITMTNKDVEYFIWHNFRGEDGAGVEVTKNGKSLATTHCSTEREIISNF